MPNGFSVVGQSLRGLGTRLRAHKKLAPGVVGRYYQGRISRLLGRSFIAHVGRSIRPTRGFNTVRPKTRRR